MSVIEKDVALHVRNNILKQLLILMISLFFITGIWVGMRDGSDPFDVYKLWYEEGAWAKILAVLESVAVYGIFIFVFIMALVASLGILYSWTIFSKSRLIKFGEDCMIYKDDKDNEVELRFKKIKLVSIDYKSVLCTDAFDEIVVIENIPEFVFGAFYSQKSIDFLIKKLKSEEIEAVQVHSKIMSWWDEIVANVMFIFTTKRRLLKSKKKCSNCGKKMKVDVYQCKKCMSNQTGIGFMAGIVNFASINIFKIVFFLFIMYLLSWHLILASLFLFATIIYYSVKMTLNRKQYEENINELTRDYKRYKYKFLAWFILYGAMGLFAVYTNPTSQDFLTQINQKVSEEIESEYGLPSQATEILLKVSEKKLEPFNIVQRNNYIFFSTFTISDDLAIIEEFRTPKIVGVAGYYFEPNIAEFAFRKSIISSIRNMHTTQ